MSEDWKPEVSVEDLETFAESKMWKTLREFLGFQRDGILEDLTSEKDYTILMELQGELKLLKLAIDLPLQVKQFMETNLILEETKE